MSSECSALIFTTVQRKWWDPYVKCKTILTFHPKCTPVKWSTCTQGLFLFKEHHLTTCDHWGHWERHDYCIGMLAVLLKVLAPNVSSLYDMLYNAQCCSLVQLLLCPSQSPVYLRSWKCASAVPLTAPVASAGFQVVYYIATACYTVYSNSSQLPFYLTQYTLFCWTS